MKRFLLFLLALMGCGLSSCDIRAEYGTPHVSFRATARVVTEEGNPVEGIRVAIYHQSWDGEYYCEDFEWRTGYTDYEGRIDATASPHSVPDKLVVEDVDGEANGGEFESQIIELTGKWQQTADGDGNWYGGEYKATLGDIVLQQKEQKEE